MLEFSLFLSLAILAVVVGFGQGRNGPSRALIAGAIGLLPLLFVAPFFPAVAVQYLLTLLAALLCLAARARTRTLVLCAASVMLSVYLFVLADVQEITKRRERLRAEYPYESLAPRLAYETAQEIEADPDAPVVAPQPVVLSAQAEQGLSESERLLTFSGRRGWSEARSIALEALHSRRRDDFVSSPGFGVMRMSPAQAARLRPEHYIDLPPDEPIPQPNPESRPEPPTYDDAPPVGPADADGGEPAVSPAAKSLEEMHLASYVDFSNPEGFGHVRDRNHVAGFQSHRFRNSPALPQDDAAHERWRLARLELVSLLKYKRPAVYVSEYLPRMDQLSEAPTRPLTAFEQRGLDTLRQGEELAVESDLNEIRMLGALRAVGQCVECHQVRRGALLGAFSYRLIRDPAIRPPQESAPGQDGRQARRWSRSRLGLARVPSGNEFLFVD